MNFAFETNILPSQELHTNIVLNYLKIPYVYADNLYPDRLSLFLPEDISSDKVSEFYRTFAEFSFRWKKVLKETNYLTPEECSDCSLFVYIGCEKEIHPEKEFLVKEYFRNVDIINFLTS